MTGDTEQYVIDANVFISPSVDTAAISSAFCRNALWC